MNQVPSKSLQTLEVVFQFNYYLALAVSAFVAALAIMQGEWLFQLDSQLYGPLVNNIKIALLYASLGELLLFGFCRYKQNYKQLVPMGFFLILMIGALEFYGQVNRLPIDPALNLLFLFVGLSHLAYGLVSSIKYGQRRS